jgi:putative flippase GtrA
MEVQPEVLFQRLPLPTQLARFGVVGGFTAALDFGLLFALVKYAHINYFYSASVAFTAASVLNYVLSARYVFPASRFSRGSEFTLFMVTTCAGLALNQLTMWLFVGILSANYLLAKCASLIIVTVWNFLSKKKIVFLC